MNIIEQHKQIFEQKNSLGFWMSWQYFPQNLDDKRARNLAQLLSNQVEAEGADEFLLRIASRFYANMSSFAFFGHGIMTGPTGHAYSANERGCSAHPLHAVTYRTPVMLKEKDNVENYAEQLADHFNDQVINNVLGKATQRNSIQSEDINFAVGNEHGIQRLRLAYGFKGDCVHDSHTKYVGTISNIKVYYNPAATAILLGDSLERLFQFHVYRFEMMENQFCLRAAKILLPGNKYEKFVP